MHFEIERKFLVIGEFRDQAYDSSRIRQGYISSGNGRTVRVRIRDDKGYLTIKGPSNRAGLARYEFEIEIPLSDAEDLMRRNYNSSFQSDGVINLADDLISYSTQKGIAWDDFFAAEDDPAQLV